MLFSKSYRRFHVVKGEATFRKCATKDEADACVEFFPTMRLGVKEVFHFGMLLYDLTFAIVVFICLGLLLAGKPVDAACGMYVMRIIVNVAFGSDDGE